jgi:nicotinamide-nucleotide amidase
MEAFVERSPQQRLAELLAKGDRGLLAIAESCTGGLVAERITAIAGSSAYFDRGWVVYSNLAKRELLGVDERLLEREGAVSRACAEALLEGIFARSPARLGAAVTGIAGPDGGTTQKPVGTVWIAWGTPERRRSELLSLRGTRGEIRSEAADKILLRLCEAALWES